MLHYSVFCREHPIQEMDIDGSIFKYRHYINIEAKTTIVLLVGGIGLSDMMYTCYLRFAQKFSVITFDYSEHYKTNDEICKAINELLTRQNIKAWFVGQSFGGFIAQIMATKYSNVVEGLILSNTGSTSEYLSEKAKASLVEVIESTKKNKKRLKLTPLSVSKILLKEKINKRYGKAFNDKERARLKNVFDIMGKRLTKSYELHLLDLLIDLENHFGIKQSCFEYLNDKVLLILSDDANTFHKEVEDSLMTLMPSATIITNFKCEDWALFVNNQKYVEIITGYILTRTL